MKRVEGRVRWLNGPPWADATHRRGLWPCRRCFSACPVGSRAAQHSTAHHSRQAGTTGEPKRTCVRRRLSLLPVARGTTPVHPSPRGPAARRCVPKRPAHCPTIPHPHPYAWTRPRQHLPHPAPRVRRPPGAALLPLWAAAHVRGQLHGIPGALACLSHACRLFIPHVFVFSVKLSVAVWQWVRGDGSLAGGPGAYRRGRRQGMQRQMRSARVALASMPWSSVGSRHQATLACLCALRSATTKAGW